MVFFLRCPGHAQWHLKSAGFPASRTHICGDRNGLLRQSHRSFRPTTPSAHPYTSALLRNNRTSRNVERIPLLLLHPRFESATYDEYQPTAAPLPPTTMTIWSDDPALESDFIVPVGGPMESFDPASSVELTLSQLLEGYAGDKMVVPTFAPVARPDNTAQPIAVVEPNDIILGDLDALIDSALGLATSSGQPWEPTQPQATVVPDVTPVQTPASITSGRTGRTQITARSRIRQRVSPTRVSGAGKKKSLGKQRLNTTPPSHKHLDKLPANHKPARGRGRHRQLANMTEEQKAAEAAARLEKNRQSAREFRSRRKNMIASLELKLEEYEDRNHEQLELIAKLERKVLEMRQLVQRL